MEVKALQIALNRQCFRTTAAETDMESREEKTCQRLYLPTGLHQKWKQFVLFFE